VALTWSPPGRARWHEGGAPFELAARSVVVLGAAGHGLRS